jgi:hypothetical protein
MVNQEEAVNADRFVAVCVNRYIVLTAEKLCCIAAEISPKPGIVTVQPIEFSSTSGWCWEICCPVKTKGQHWHLGCE